ncbi:hypothetical protein KCP76_26215 (plasmid) [Salmonella enterica subsp. enterica serovar Weltevreden]|nr:hypothetical protein KCP76_26215 [Salmonella enterica subsp. enterica serovar Weltevreden]QUJ01287.1 hypothetical protein KCP73_26955 [Salmonella enterica subsp. enterica]
MKSSPALPPGASSNACLPETGRGVEHYQRAGFPRVPAHRQRSHPIESQKFFPASSCVCKQLVLVFHECDP